MKQKQKKIVGNLVVVVIVSVICWLGLGFGVLGSWQYKLSNFYYNSGEVSDEIVIVGLDDKSVNAQSRGIEIKDRAVIADIFDKIAVARPRVFAIDYIFNGFSSGIEGADLNSIVKTVVEENLDKNEIAQELKPYLSTPNPTDTRLRNSLLKFKNLIVATIPSNDSLGHENTKLLGKEISSENFFLSDNAKNGMVVVRIDNGDTVVRKGFTEFESIDGKVIESLPVAVAKAYGETPQIPVIDSLKRMYINYFGDPGSFKVISAIDVYEGKVSSSVLHDKIVLFGVVSAVFNDLEHTPIAPEWQMAGIEILANSIQTILDEAYLVDEELAIKIAVVVILTLVVSGVFFWSDLRVANAVAVICFISYLFLTKILFEKGVIMDLVYPYFAIIFSIMLSLIYRHFIENKQKEFLVKAFSSYVNPTIVKSIEKSTDEIKLGGVEVTATTLFLDIKDFTTISEKLSPQELVLLLNEFFHQLSEEILRFDGTIDKFEGDSIMAVFGVPLKDEAHAVKACASIGAILDRASKFLSPIPQVQNLSIRVGVNTGKVVAGNIGSKNKFNYTVMGDSVNLASRLEGVNKIYGTQNLVGQETFNLAKSYFSFRMIDKIKVKGKTESTFVYTLEGAKSEALEQKCKDYGVALNSYFNKNFTDAKSKFEAYAATHKSDATIMIERCSEFIKNPPQDSWDGSLELHVK